MRIARPELLFVLQKTGYGGLSGGPSSNLSKGIGLIPSSRTTSGLRDNFTRGTVAAFLAEKIQEGSLLSVVSAYFTIYAYDALKDSLDRIEHLDFLFGE